LQPDEVGDQLILPRQDIGDPVIESVAVPIAGCFCDEALSAADPESLYENKNPSPVSPP
jgi:hypothetical protein